MEIILATKDNMNELIELVRNEFSKNETKRYTEKLSHKFGYLSKENYSNKEFIDKFKFNNTLELYIAYENNEVMGMLDYHIDSCIGHINYLLVHDKHQRKGIGTALLYSAGKFLQEEDIEQIELVPSLEGLDLYNKYGFECNSKGLTIYVTELIENIENKNPEIEYEINY